MKKQYRPWRALEVVILEALVFWPLAASGQHPANPPSVPAGYRLTWFDEFDDDVLDTDKWAYRVDNKHRSIQRRENVSLEDGSLVLALEVLNTPIEGKRAAGAGVVSKRRFRYGYYEVRARLGIPGQPERGWHHAFWAMAAEVDDEGNVSTTYPGIRRTEIDCYENPTEHRHEGNLNGLNNFTQHVIVWGENGKEVGRLPTPPEDVNQNEKFSAADWHTYAFEWTPAEVRFFVDGELTKVADYPAEEYIHDEVNLWITAISANWNIGGQIPSRAEYDYIRCYEPNNE